MLYLPIGGTWGRKNQNDWYKAGSWFENMMNSHGHQRVGRKLRFWSHGLSGTFGCGNDRLVWEFGGEVLNSWSIEHGPSPSQLIIIAHSHGGQVAAFALAGGVECHTLITIDTPIRDDMTEVWEAGVENRVEHNHLFGTGWASRMRIFGQRRFGRRMPTSTKNTGISGGHNGMVTESSKYLAQWEDILA